jgi:hypothetical protein
MNFVVPDDYDKAYLGSSHLERLLPHGKVQVYTDPPRDESELLDRLRTAEVVTPSGNAPPSRPSGSSPSRAFASSP